MNKTIIRSKIMESPGLKSALEFHRARGSKVTEYTNLPRDVFHSYSQANGLVNLLYVITVNGEVTEILMPLFSTNKTITWNMEYIDNISSAISKDHRISIERLYEITRLAMFVGDKKEFNYVGRVDADAFVMHGHRSHFNSQSLYIYNKDIRKFATQFNKK